MENFYAKIIKNIIKVKKEYILFALFLLAFAVAFAFVYTSEIDVSRSVSGRTSLAKDSYARAARKVLPKEGIEVPAKWGDIGAKMVESGVIDAEKFEGLYKDRGGMDEYTKKLLYGRENGNLKITPENAGVILNLLWALGLGNKNNVLETGPMMEGGREGSGGFASTGGWTLAKGDAMEHYARHSFLVLTKNQQVLVEKVSKGIYRPCCNNAVYFPDCNHGMAMLGLLELMASQGANEDEMYRVALRVNSYWFSDTYLTIAAFLESRGISWESVDPKEILGKNFSSASGYKEILQQVNPPDTKGGGSCGV